MIQVLVMISSCILFSTYPLHVFWVATAVTTMLVLHSVWGCIRVLDSKSAVMREAAYKSANSGNKYWIISLVIATCYFAVGLIIPAILVFIGMVIDAAVVQFYKGEK